MPRARRPSAGRAETKKIRQCDQEIAKKREATQAWREKLSPDDVETALAQARQFDGRNALLSSSRPGGGSAACSIGAYDFSQHKVRPSWVRILDQLREEHQAVARRDELARRDLSLLRLGGRFRPVRRPSCRRCSRQSTNLPDSVRSLHATSRRRPAATPPILGAGRAFRRSEPAGGQLRRIPRRVSAREPARAGRRAFGEMEDSLDELPDYLHCLTQLNAIPAETGRVDPHAFRSVCRRGGGDGRTQPAAGLARPCRRPLRRNGPAAARSRGSAVSATNWQKQNAQRVREFIRQTFLDNVNTLAKPAAQLSVAAERHSSKTYNRGRRELEHEFAKTMRYKSIRDLMSGDSGSVIRDLKPVWLMSPLSVSDTLPLNADNFDVVIFDEASQITLEEAVPSIFRPGRRSSSATRCSCPRRHFFMSPTPGRRGRADVRGERRAGDLRRRQQQLPQPGRPQPARRACSPGTTAASRNR